MELYDRDGNERALMSTQTTNSAGAFDFSVTCNQDATESGNMRAIDPLLVIRMERLTPSKLSLGNADDEPYRWEFTAPNDACGELDVGHLQYAALSEWELIWGWGAAIESLAAARSMWPSTAWNALKIRTSVDGLDVAHYLPDDDVIEFPSDPWVSTMYHETGHYIADMVRGNTPYDSHKADSNTDAGGPGHGHCEEIQHEAFAWNEGIASFWRSLNYGPDSMLCWDVEGPRQERNVQMILQDWCDPICVSETNAGFSESVAQSDWSQHYAQYVRSAASIRGLDTQLGGTSRALTVAADRGRWDINDPPTSVALHNPTSGAVVGRAITIHGSWNDPDTIVNQAIVSLSTSGSSCGDTQHIWLNTARVGTYWAPDYNDVRGAYVCVVGMDELGDRAATSLTSSAFQLDTQEPRSTTTVTRPPTTPTAWTVSWTADDFPGAGIASVSVYEQKPGGNWQVIKTASTSSGSVSSGYNVGEPTGRYCYATVAIDKVGNVEAGPTEETCFSYPV